MVFAPLPKGAKTQHAFSKMLRRNAQKQKGE
jgi:hypothetical protein